MAANADLYLKPRQLYAIGLFAAQWAYFEAELDFTIAALGEFVEGNQQMPPTFKPRVKHWRRLSNAYYQSQPVLLNEIKEIIDDAAKMHRGRSVILHGRVYGDTQPKSRRLYMEGHRHLADWRVEFRQTTASLLIEGAELIKRLTERLMEFNEKHLPISPASLPRRYA